MTVAMPKDKDELSRNDLTILYSTDQFFPCLEKSIGAKKRLGITAIYIYTIAGAALLSLRRCLVIYLYYSHKIRISSMIVVSYHTQL